MHLVEHNRRHIRQLGISEEASHEDTRCHELHEGVARERRVTAHRIGDAVGERRGGL